MINAYRARERAYFWRAALVARTVYTMHRPPKAKDLQIEDFMPSERPVVRQQTREQQKAILQQWKAVLSGR